MERVTSYNAWDPSKCFQLHFLPHVINLDLSENCIEYDSIFLPLSLPESFAHKDCVGLLRRH